MFIEPSEDMLALIEQRGRLENRLQLVNESLADEKVKQAILQLGLSAGGAVVIRGERHRVSSVLVSDGGKVAVRARAVNPDGEQSLIPCTTDDFTI